MKTEDAKPYRADEPLIETLKGALLMIRRLKGCAWVGSRIPYERDPDYIACLTEEKRIEAAIKKAEER